MKLSIYTFLIKDDELLEKYNEIRDKVSNSVKKGFHSESLYNEKYLKSEIESCEEKSTQIFMVIRYQRKVFVASVYQYH